VRRVRLWRKRSRLWIWCCRLRRCQKLRHCRLGSSDSTTNSWSITWRWEIPFLRL